MSMLVCAGSRDTDDEGEGEPVGHEAPQTEQVTRVVRAAHVARARAMLEALLAEQVCKGGVHRGK